MTRDGTFSIRFGLAVALFSASASLAPEAFSQDADSRYELRIEGGTLLPTARSIREQTGVEIVYSFDLVDENGINPVQGQYTLEQALAIMFEGTDLTGSLTESGMIVITRKTSAQAPIREETDMNTRTKRSLLAGASAIVFGTSTQGAAIAQDAPAEDEVKREDTITVTAQKREQSLQDVPMSIAAITGQQLEDQGITDILDLALAVPGVSVQDLGAQQRRITIRGVGNTFGTSSLVGVYVDEIPVTAQPFLQPDIRIHDLERVEVLRGPQGTLYGQGSSGGTIRFITKQPDLTSFDASTDFTGSATEGGGANYEMRGIANIPLVDDKFAVRLSGTFTRDSGWIDQPSRDLSDINDQELFNVRAKALFKPTASFSLEGTAIVHRNNAGAAPTGEDDDGNFEFVFGLPLTTSIDDNYELFNLTATKDFGALQILSTSSYISTEKKTNNAGSSFPFLPEPAPRDAQYFNSLLESDIFTQELRLSSAGNSDLNWTLGAFYRDAEITSATLDYFFGTIGGTPFGPVDFSSVENSESWAVFGQASYLFADRLEVGAGVRYFEDEREITEDFFGVSEQDAKFDSVNPRVFLRYDLADDVSIYANVAKGFRSGGFNSIGQDAFKPEDIWSYEAGVKFASMGGQLTGELTGYFSEYSDIQIVGLIPAGPIVTNQTSNIGEAEIRGIEGALTYYSGSGFSIGLSGNYTDTEITEVDLASVAGIAATHEVGDPLDLVPEYNLAAWASYEFDWTPDYDGTFRVEFNQQGKATYRNRSFGPHYFSESDSISALDATLGAAKDNWTAELFVDNLLDERGFIDPFHLEMDGARPRPRTVGLRIDLDL